jgi:hypothetical protein
MTRADVVNLLGINIVLTRNSLWKDASKCAPKRRSSKKTALKVVAPEKSAHKTAESSTPRKAVLALVPKGRTSCVTIEQRSSDVNYNDKSANNFIDTLL